MWTALPSSAEPSQKIRERPFLARTVVEQLELDGLWLNRPTHFRSPRPACGERSDCGAIRVRGTLPRGELSERAPHPNPLPAKSGEREKRSVAASPPTQPNLIML